MIDFIIGRFNFCVYIILMMIGLYAMIVKKNLVKKIIGMNIFQTAIIVFFISLAPKKNATLPILENGHGAHDAAVHITDVAGIINPLPHVLMLTAIVVMVATLGVALAILMIIYRKYGTIEEDEILKRIK